MCPVGSHGEREKKKNNTGFLYKESSRIIFCSSVDMLSNFKFSYFGFIFFGKISDHDAQVSKKWDLNFCDFSGAADKRHPVTS